MSLNNIILNESDLRQMPSELREGLLKWYFSRSILAAEVPLKGAPVPPVVPLREDSDRVRFSELARAGLLAPGDAIVCKALGRQRRDGSEPFLEAGKVLEDGTVEYSGRRHDVPSKLALDVVNTNGGNAKAVGGYAYIWVQTSKGLVPLSELRDIFLRRND